MSSDGKSRTAVRRLRELVRSLDAGTRIPSERELAAEWGVARMTARKAIETLTAEGWLDRRHGSGTYVAHPPDARTRGLTSFTRAMRQRGLRPSTEVLDFRHSPADAATAERLQIAPGDDVVAFTRLRLADDEPVGVETTWMPGALVPGLTPAALEGSLFETLTADFGVTLGEALSTIDPVLPDAATAAALATAPTEPCLRIRMDYVDHRKRPVMAATCLYRGDRYQVHVALTANALASDQRVPS